MISIVNCTRACKVFVRATTEPVCYSFAMPGIGDSQYRKLANEI